MFKGTHGANRMQSPEQTAEHQQVIGVVQLRRAAAETLEHTETKAGKLEQRLTVDLHGWDHRDIAFGQLQGELMLFQNRRITPALRAVEFGNQWLAIFDSNLEYAVLVTVQRQRTGIAEEAERLHRVQHGIGGQQGERVTHQLLLMSGEPQAAGYKQSVS